MQKFRKGDRVLVEAVIASDFAHDGKQKVAVLYDEFYAVIKDMTMVHPVIAIGDTLRLKDGSGPSSATVLAIADDHVWVSFGDGNYATWWLSFVERIDGDEAEDTAVAA